MQRQWVEGSTVVIQTDWGEERHKFATRPEAEIRAAFITELLEWNGTPFVHVACVKGQKGGAVDCAQLLWAGATKVELIKDVPRPKYSPNIIRGREESFVNFLLSLGATEIQEPRVGDVLTYFFGRIYGHGGVLINSQQIIHAHGAAGQVTISFLHEPLLVEIQRTNIKRPVRYFSIWKG